MSALCVPQSDGADVIDQYPITLSEFKDWLETKRPTALVGFRASLTGCPIGSYIESRGEAASVGTVFIITGYDEGATLFRETPAWAATFIEVVDGSGEPFAGVQARTALRLLGRVADATLPPEDDAERLRLETEVVRG